MSATAPADALGILSLLWDRAEWVSLVVHGLTLSFSLDESILQGRLKKEKEKKTLS